MGYILGFAGSSSNKSINKQLVQHTLDGIGDHDTMILDLNDFVMPIYDIDLEQEQGIPEKALEFKKHIEETEAIVVSFAEHNGSYATAIKNILDWCSRIEGPLWADKPVLVMASSPGARGGSTVLEHAAARIPFNGGRVVSQFSLPEFYNNFDGEKGIIDKDLHNEHQKALAILLSAI